jgi:hypothetical protein
MSMRACLKLAVLAGVMLAAGPVHADVYVWKDPQTGRTRMTSTPPEWVREGTSGPTVEVIRENRVIAPAAAFAKPQAPAELSARQRATASQAERKPPAAAEAGDAASVTGQQAGQ